MLIIDPLAVTPMPKTCPAWSDEKPGQVRREGGQAAQGTSKGLLHLQCMRHVVREGLNPWHHES